MENNQMTVREALEITANNLGNIPIPRALNQLIGIPIDMAIANIQACIEAMDRQQMEAEGQTEGQPEENANGNDHAE